MPLYFFVSDFIRPPSAMIFWMNGGKGSAWKVLPVVSSVMTPVSKSTLTVSPCADGVHGLGALHDGQADVDAVAVEDAGEALGDDDSRCRRS